MQNYQNRIPKQIWKDSSRYQDIMGLSRPVSANHPPMNRTSRAAQFSPFAALTGHNDVIRETARLTSPWVELDEQSVGILNEKLQILRCHLVGHPEVTITYFEPDDKKDGGSYQTVTGNVKKIEGIPAGTGFTGWYGDTDAACNRAGWQNICGVRAGVGCVCRIFD